MRFQRRLHVRRQYHAKVPVNPLVVTATSAGRLIVGACRARRARRPHLAALPLLILDRLKERAGSVNRKAARFQLGARPNADPVAGLQLVQHRNLARAEILVWPPFTGKESAVVLPTQLGLRRHRTAALDSELHFNGGDRKTVDGSAVTARCATTVYSPSSGMTSRSVSSVLLPSSSVKLAFVDGRRRVRDLQDHASTR